MPKTVLITGAGSGFGRMAAVRLAERGHKVIAGVLDDKQKADLSKAEPKLTVVKLDITDAKDVAAMDQLVKRITVGQLDPVDVAKRYVELVEAETTELVNFVPPDIVERMSKVMAS